MKLSLSITIEIPSPKPPAAPDKHLGSSQQVVPIRPGERRHTKPRLGFTVNPPEDQ